MEQDATVSRTGDGVETSSGSFPTGRCEASSVSWRPVIYTPLWYGATVHTPVAEPQRQDASPPAIEGEASAGVMPEPAQPLSPPIPPPVRVHLCRAYRP